MKASPAELKPPEKEFKSKPIQWNNQIVWTELYCFQYEVHDLKKAIESELFKCYINVILATKGQIKSGSRLKPSTKRGDKFIDQGFNWQLGGQ